MTYIFKAIAVALFFAVAVIAWALLMTVIIYPSWNFGAAHAFGCNELSVFEAFWFSLFISSVGQRFKSDKKE